MGPFALLSDMPDAPLTTCPILHRDRFLVIVNKPAGVLSHPNSARINAGERAAFEGRYHLDDRRFDTSAGSIWLIHRLDQDTSGVLLAALDEKNAAKCRAAFEQEAVQKTYLALVRGNPGPAGTWLDHLTMTRGRGKVRTAVLKGRPPNAELRFRNLGYSAAHRLSLLEVTLITGKTHQIRVQCASRQHPVLGDDVYGDFDLNRRLRKDLHLRRLFLHAQRLEFKHPASGQQLTVSAPLPEDLTGVLERIGLA